MLTGAAVAVLGLLFVRRGCRAAGLPPAARHLILAIYGVRALAGAAFLLISAFGLPVFAEYQMSRGFWVFAPDATTYHHYAISMLASWRHNLEFVIPTTGVAFQVYCGIVYRLIGPSPLGLIELNSWYMALAALLSYRTVRMVGAGPRAAAAAAALVGFWPSSFLWSSTITKDPLCLWLQMAATFLVIRLVRWWLAAPTDERAAQTLGPLAQVLGVCAAVFALIQLRDYQGQFVAVIVWILSAAVLAAMALRRNRVRAERALLTGLLLALAFMASGWVNLLALVAPRHPQRMESWEAFDRFVQAHDPLQYRVVEEEEAPAEAGTVRRTAPRPAPAMFPPRDLIASTEQPPLEELLVPKFRVNFFSSEMKLKHLRDGFATSGGKLVAMDQIALDTLKEILKSLPASVGVALWYPPLRDWGALCSDGLHAKLYVVESALLRALSLLMLAGFAWCLSRRFWNGVGLCLAGGLFLVLLGLVVANFGTLFRLRLLPLLPLFCLAGIGVEGASAWWAALARWRNAGRPSPAEPAVESDMAEALK